MMRAYNGALLLSAAMVMVGASGCTDASTEDGPLLPKAEVEILVDDAGIPHIYAQDDEDLFFAYGYQLASDRMLQLALFRRYAYGRLSEVLGATGPGSVGATALIDDQMARIMNFKHWGKLDAELMQREEPEHYQLTSAWVAGINHRVDEIRSGAVPAPLGFGPDYLDFMPERWADEDVYVIQKMVNFGLDLTLEFEVLLTFVGRLAPDALDKVEIFKPARPVFAVPEDERPLSANSMGGESAARWHAPASAFTARDAGDLTQLPSFAQLGRLADSSPLGSNNWAVHGRHTESGMPIVAGDPHLGFNFSGITYALHLNSKDAGGTFNTTGFAFVGAPGIFAGHNDRVAYTETSAFADVMDLWAVKIEDGKANVGGTEVAVVEREEIITVRDAEPVVITVIDVPGHGIILPPELVGSPLPIADGGREALVGWTGFRARPARFFRELMRVQSVDEFESAVDRMVEMTYNFVAADAEAISYRVGVEVPARNAPAPGREPWHLMDGDDPRAWWPEGQFLGPEQKPHSRAESRGFIVTANNDPLGFTADGDLANDPWYYGALFPPGWRAARIDAELERLVGQGALTVEAMQALQMDVRSNLADDLVPVIAEAHAAIATDADLAEFSGRQDIEALVELLTVDWDRQMARDSAGAVVFHAFSHIVAREVIADDISPILFQFILDKAPMYLLKIAMLALTGQYEGGDAALQEGRERLVLQALDATALFLTERFGGVDPTLYTYADMRVTDLDYAYGRPVTIGKVPTDGGEDTVNVAQSVFMDGAEIAEQWVAHWGPVERQVMSFDADGTPFSLANYALGNVADPSSPHFDDALEDWVDGRYRKLLFARSEIEAREERRIVLEAAR